MTPLTRDDLMVLERGLQDRIEALEGNFKIVRMGPLVKNEIDKCNRLRAILNAEIDKAIKLCP